MTFAKAVALRLLAVVKVRLLQPLGRVRVPGEDGRQVVGQREVLIPLRALDPQAQVAGAGGHRPQAHPHRQQEISERELADAVRQLLHGRIVVQEDDAHLVLGSHAAPRVAVPASRVVDTLCHQVIARHEIHLQAAHRLIVEVVVAVLEGDGQLGPISDMAQLDLGAQEVGVRQAGKHADALAGQGGGGAEGGAVPHGGEGGLARGYEVEGGDVVAGGEHG